MCSRAAWKELEALSNQEGSSDCYPFNYVVWVSTVVKAQAGWGHAGGGLCSSSMCVCVHVRLWVSAELFLNCMQSLLCLKCVWESEQLQMCNMFKCVYSLFVVHQRVSLVCVIHSFSSSEPSVTCLCIQPQPQKAEVSEWLFVFLFRLNPPLFTFSLSSRPFLSLCPLCLHLFLLLLFLSVFPLQMASCTRPP